MARVYNEATTNPVEGPFNGQERTPTHERLLAANIQVSIDGRALDNVFCERSWRSVKYENIYLNQYDTVRQLQTGLTAYFDFYNYERPHQSLNYRKPAEEHFVL